MDNLVLPVRTAVVTEEEGVVHKERPVSDLMQLIRIDVNYGTYPQEPDSVKMEFLVTGYREEKSKVYALLRELWRSQCFT